MAGGYDGSVKINTELNTKDASSQMMSLENRIEKTAQKVQSLKDKMDAAAKAKVPTEEYKELQRTLARDNQELEKLIQKQEQWNGKRAGAKWNALDAQVEQKGSDVRAQEAYMKQMRKEGTAFMPGTQTSEYMSLSEQYSSAQKDLEVLNKKHDELIAKQIKAGKTGADSMERISKSAKKSANSIDTFGRRLTQLVKQVFVFSVITKLLNSMRTALASGLKEFAQYSDSYNRAMSDFQSSTDNMKNSLAAAFAPIITTAIPYLTKFIDFLTNAINAVNKFISALMGKSTWTRAVKQQKQYAGALDDTAESAKEAQKAVAGYDKLNVLNSDKSSGKKTKSKSSGTVWEEVPLTEKDFAWIEKVKKILKTILPIVLAIGTAMAAWKIAGFLSGLMKTNPVLGKILATIAAIAGLAMEAWSYMDMWNNGINWKNLLVNLAGTALAFGGIFALFGKKGAGIFLVIDGIAKMVTAIHDIVENGLTWENATILLMGVLETFGGFLLLYGSKYIIPFGKSLLAGIGGAFSGVPLLMQTSLTDIIAGVKMGEIGAATLGATIGTTIVAAIVAAIVGFKLGEKINEWITGEQIDMSFSEMMGEIKESVTDGTWKEALALWKEDIDDGLIAINDDYNEWTKGIREKISTAFDETKQDFAQVKAEFKQGLAELKNDIKEELNGGIGHVEGFINKVVSGINSLISLLNAIKVDIPDNVPIIGGVSWGGLNLTPLNTVKIPRLANGGIATSSTIVNIAEQGKEAVLPLENNTGWMDDLANKLSQKIEVTVVPVPDPSGIFETVRVQAVEYNKSTGDRAFS